MIMRMFKRTVVAEKSVAHFCQILCSVVAGLVLTFGIRRLAELDLTESQFVLRDDLHAAFDGRFHRPRIPVSSLAKSGLREGL